MHPGLKLALQFMGGGAALNGLGNLLTPNDSYWQSVDRNAGGETPYTPEEQRALRRKGLAQDMVNGAGFGLPGVVMGWGDDQKKGNAARAQQLAAAMLFAQHYGDGAKLNPQKYGYLKDKEKYAHLLAEGNTPDNGIF